MGYILTINHLSLYIYIIYIIYIYNIYIYIYIYTYGLYNDIHTDSILYIIYIYMESPQFSYGSSTKTWFPHRSSAQRGLGDAVAQGLSAGRLPQAARFDGGAAVAGDGPLGGAALANGNGMGNAMCLMGKSWNICKTYREIWEYP
jgi:hypothetical protein